jgi:hypothetical protein
VIVLIGRERIEQWTAALRAAIYRLGKQLLTRPAAVGDAARKGN